MSADNRILIHQNHNTEKWYVWEGSCSVSYFEPPEEAKAFDTEELALAHAYVLEDRGYYEGGIQRLSEPEVFSGLKEEVEFLKRENSELKELVDGAYNIVELWNTEGSEYNTNIWKPEWLKKAKRLVPDCDFLI